MGKTFLLELLPEAKQQLNSVNSTANTINATTNLLCEYHDNQFRNNATRLSMHLIPWEDFCLSFHLYNSVARIKNLEIYTIMTSSNKLTPWTRGLVEKLIVAHTTHKPHALYTVEPQGP